MSYKIRGIAVSIITKKAQLFTASFGLNLIKVIERKRYTIRC